MTDLNPDLMMMWAEVQNGWIPPTSYTQAKYDRMKNAESSAERGFVGFALSYGGCWFGSYRNKHDHSKDYCAPSSKNVVKVGRMMDEVKFLTAQPYYAHNPKNMLIYCDPPYEGNNARSKYFSKFDHEAFWENMTEWSKNNVVIVSERVAPDDWKCIWRKQYSVTYRRKNTYNECLFIHESWYNKLSKKMYRI